MKTKSYLLMGVLCICLAVGYASAGVQNQRRNGFSEAQIAEISAMFPGCLENATSSNFESEDQLDKNSGLLPARAGAGARQSRSGTPQESDR